MPAGLDGHPDPIVTPARTAVLERVADLVEARTGSRVLVAIDGRAGSGKSTFGDELCRSLERRGRSVVRSTTDLFHRPRTERMRRGTSSPEGYYEDSHQLDVIVGELLEPFRSGAAEVLAGAFDEPSDQPQLVRAEVPGDAVLVFDGLFLRRPELRGYWDLTVMLHADQRCDAAWLSYLEHDLPADASERAAAIDLRLRRARWPRYRDGWSRYLEVVDEFPAAIDIANDDLASPTVLRSC